jgi:hypothetical protein
MLEDEESMVLRNMHKHTRLHETTSQNIFIHGEKHIIQDRLSIVLGWNLVLFDPPPV